MGRKKVIIPDKYKKDVEYLQHLYSLRNMYKHQLYFLFTYRGMRQVELAKVLGLGQSTVSENITEVKEGGDLT
jgi:hypothetical protein